MAEENLRAAKSLKDSGYLRSAINRAYYSAYASTTGALEQGGTSLGAADRPNPGHEQLSKLIRHNLEPKRLSDVQRRDLARRFRDLRRLRVMSDYDPSSYISPREALLCVRNASVFLGTLSEGAES